ncbi:hypothetical protein ACH429_20290 [Streptomyces pathocidini]|uniref:Uncharacterized protein n=1 Tax=Streptomyces pathocidini TaxID=1650571 RepID=A0ABW7UV02_9ACTN|nr:hypothetical protein [Streptomyces pathocidini]
MAWTDDNNRDTTGFLTVDHLGGPVIPSSHNLPSIQLPVIGQTGRADLELIAPIKTDDPFDWIWPTIVTSSGQTFGVVDYAREGDIRVGQRICHGGWNPITVARGGVVCGTVTDVGPTHKCEANPNLGKSTCVVRFTGDDGLSGGPGDSGAAVWLEDPAGNPGNIKVIGIYGAGSGATGYFEPTYAATQIFGGRPLTAGSQK